MSERDKAEKFRELATKRVNRAIKDLRLIGNLANQNNYAYTDDQVSKIVSALNAEVRTLKRRFEEEGNSDEPAFSL